MLNVEELSNHKPYYNIRVSTECTGRREVRRERERERVREDRVERKEGEVRKD